MTGGDRKGDIGVGKMVAVGPRKMVLIKWSGFCYKRGEEVWAVWPYPGDNQSGELDQIAGTWANSVSLDLSSRQEAW